MRPRKAYILYFLKRWGLVRGTVLEKLHLTNSKTGQTSIHYLVTIKNPDTDNEDKFVIPKAYVKFNYEEALVESLDEVSELLIKNTEEYILLDNLIRELTEKLKKLKGSIEE